jgi:hypothetical protein
MNVQHLTKLIGDWSTRFKISKSFQMRFAFYLFAFTKKDKTVLPFLDSSFFALSQNTWIMQTFDTKPSKKTRALCLLPKPSDPEEKRKAEIFWNRLIRSCIQILEHERKVVLTASQVDKAIQLFTLLYSDSAPPALVEAKPSLTKPLSVFEVPLKKASSALDL